MKNLKIILMLIFLNLVLCSCTHDIEQTLKKVNLIEPARTVFYCPLYVAHECGFFEEEGLKIQIKTANGSDKVMTSVLSHGSDIGLLGVEAPIYVYNEGKENPPRIFAQLTKKDGSFLVSKSSEFKSWDDLKGKSVITGRIGSMPEMCIEHILKKKGIFSDVNLITNVQFDLMGAAFSSGVGDYVMLFEPMSSSFERDKNYHALCSLATQCGDVAYTCFCACDEYILNNENTVQSFTNAIYKGQKWVSENNANKIVDVVSKYFPDSDKSLLLKAVENYKLVSVWSKSPIIEKCGYDLAQKIIIDAGQIDKNVEFNRICDNTFATKAVSKLSL